MSMKYTRAEMEEQARLFEEKIKDPSVPESRKAIYRNTLSKINAQLNTDYISDPASEPRKRPESRPQQPRVNAKQLPRDHQVFKVDAAPADCSTTINWGDGYSFTGNEAAFRSRFTSAMRDLCDSTYAQQGRLDKISEYATYIRAIGFYRALTWFWKREPTLHDLSIMRPSELYRQIFQIIVLESGAKTVIE